TNKDHCRISVELFSRVPPSLRRASRRDNHIALIARLRFYHRTAQPTCPARASELRTPRTSIAGQVRCSACQDQASQPFSLFRSLGEARVLIGPTLLHEPPSLLSLLGQ